MDPVAIIVMLVIGAVAGWLAGVIYSGGGFGLVDNIIESAFRPDHDERMSDGRAPQRKRGVRNLAQGEPKGYCVQ